ncbi:DNA repair and recombination protein RAD54-like [Monocercomonoides exilis]|uniref:DNA repair and recombination protein RAD54-like n=1 Tax=Monocercomonoides exilis TaxID=2049356 RepID=UPI003559E3C4|nr:DNA repair and recombination protein RAD54-like [Monocercomonoides exilis]|eukprot:MONOS_9995.1-p1 / transcript=MONOS_9995.1 / gene=MONOS_9995 / organism=Monocercomonoides_exilis_PA203 / gene_product=DNA repair and recombination protein RAD54-like / transcript_product=DNA repair and recombination protein RAD54-like / location=Mono_scaffold00435:2522-8376(+) / protein_length=1574 / sequence_SO=supercontig / SO=protein_coding / is_pseudo=false
MLRTGAIRSIKSGLSNGKIQIGLLKKPFVPPFAKPQTLQNNSELPNSKISSELDEQKIPISVKKVDEEHENVNDDNLSDATKPLIKNSLHTLPSVRRIGLSSKISSHSEVKIASITSPSTKSEQLHALTDVPDKQLSYREQILKKKVDEEEKYSKEYCFRVMFTKVSNKKHKVYEDGILTIEKKTYSLYDLEGKVVAKQIICENPEKFTPGSTLRVQQKELEFLSPLSIEEVKSGRAFLTSSEFGISQPLLPTDVVSNLGKIKGLVSKYKISSNKNEDSESEKSSTKGNSLISRLPMKASKQTSLMLHGKGIMNTQKNAQPLFDPNAKGAIVVNEGHPEEDAFNRKLVSVVIDPVLANVLEPHQVEGVKFMYKCITGGDEGGWVGYGGCILADEMGLGKTMQAISLIWTALKQSALGGPLVRKAVVVCPLSLISTWKNEFKQWLGSNRIRVGYISNCGNGSVSNSILTRFIEGSMLDVIVISYESLRKYANKLAKAKVGLLVCDEGHRLKNRQTKTVESLEILHTRRRIILTGTPIQNNLDEFWSMCDFVNPESLGQYQVFKHVFARPITLAQEKNSSKKDRERAADLREELAKRTSSFILRRTKEVISLPPKHENIIYCIPSSVQQELYRRVLTMKVGEAFSSTASALLLIVYLRFLSNHPGLVAVDQNELNLKKAEEKAKNSKKKKPIRISYGKQGSSSCQSRFSKTSASTEKGKIGISPKGGANQKGAKKPGMKSRLENEEGEDDDENGSEEEEYSEAENESQDDGVKVHPYTALFRSTVSEEEMKQIDPSNITYSSKLVVLDCLLHEIHQMYPDDKVVISSMFTRMLDYISALCLKRKYSFVRLDGNTSEKKRQEAISKFTQPGSKIFLFLLSAKAGGVGLNLMAANRIVLFEPDWNPSTDQQTMARVHRHGQKKVVHIYRLITTGTIEEKILQRQLMKIGLSEDVMMDGAKKRESLGQFSSSVGSGNLSASTVKHFSKEDLRKLFQLRIDTRSDTMDILMKGNQSTFNRATSKSIVGEDVRETSSQRYELYASKSKMKTLRSSRSVSSILSQSQTDSHSGYTQPALFSQSSRVSNVLSPRSPLMFVSPLSARIMEKEESKKEEEEGSENMKKEVSLEDMNLLDEMEEVDMEKHKEDRQDFEVLANEEHNNKCNFNRDEIQSISQKEDEQFGTVTEATYNGIFSPPIGQIREDEDEEGKEEEDAEECASDGEDDDDQLPLWKLNNAGEDSDSDSDLDSINSEDDIEQKNETVCSEDKTKDENDEIDKQTGTSEEEAEEEAESDCCKGDAADPEIELLEEEEEEEEEERANERKMEEKFEKDSDEIEQNEVKPMELSEYEKGTKKKRYLSEAKSAFPRKKRMRIEEDDFDDDDDDDDKEEEGKAKMKTLKNNEISADSSNVMPKDESSKMSKGSLLSDDASDKKDDEIDKLDNESADEVEVVEQNDLYSNLPDGVFKTEEEEEEEEKKELIEEEKEASEEKAKEAEEAKEAIADWEWMIDGCEVQVEDIALRRVLRLHSIDEAAFNEEMVKTRLPLGKKKEQLPLIQANALKRDVRVISLIMHKVTQGRI